MADKRNQDNHAPESSPPIARSTRPRVSRLRSPAQFQACYGGVRAGDEHLLVFAVRNAVHHPRAGVSVSKKHGNAVARNRKKRLMREAFRLERNVLPELDFVLIPRQSGQSTMDDYRRSLVRLARRLQRKLDGLKAT